MNSDRTTLAGSQIRAAISPHAGAFGPPLFAVQGLASGQWLVRAPSDDPFLPAVVAVALLTPVQPRYRAFVVVRKLPNKKTTLLP